VARCRLLSAEQAWCCEGGKDACWISPFRPRISWWVMSNAIARIKHHSNMKFKIFFLLLIESRKVHNEVGIRLFANSFEVRVYLAHQLSQPNSDPQDLLEGVIGPALLLRPELLVVGQCVVNELLAVGVDNLLAAVGALKTC